MSGKGAGTILLLGFSQQLGDSPRAHLQRHAVIIDQNPASGEYVRLDPSFGMGSGIGPGHMNVVAGNGSGRGDDDQRGQQNDDQPPEGTGIAPHKACHQITGEERRRLCTWLKDFRLEITRHRPFTEALVTAGGVDTSEVDPRTMASRLVKGLYFAGEVLDVDGDTGGYNLQSAFSTGWVAGHWAGSNP